MNNYCNVYSVPLSWREIERERDREREREREGERERCVCTCVCIIHSVCALAYACTVHLSHSIL